LPGGVPLNVPVPEIKLPKRGDKSAGSGNGAKISLVAADGTLRELGKKDLYFNTGEQAPAALPPSRPDRVSK
jgi:hypothetical protein